MEDNKQNNKKPMWGTRKGGEGNTAKTENAEEEEKRKQGHGQAELLERELEEKRKSPSNQGREKRTAANIQHRGKCKARQKTRQKKQRDRRETRKSLQENRTWAMRDEIEYADDATVLMGKTHMNKCVKEWDAKIYINRGKRSRSTMEVGTSTNVKEEERPRTTTSTVWPDKTEDGSDYTSKRNIHNMISRGRSRGVNKQCRRSMGQSRKKTLQTQINQPHPKNTGIEITNTKHNDRWGARNPYQET